MNPISVMPNLYSADVGRAAAFYRDLLGGTQTFRTPAEGAAEHVELRLGDVIIAISSRDAVARQTRSPPSAPRGRRSWSSRTVTPPGIAVRTSPTRTATGSPW